MVPGTTCDDAGTMAGQEGQVVRRWMVQGISLLVLVAPAALATSPAGERFRGAGYFIR